MKKDYGVGTFGALNYTYIIQLLEKIKYYL